MASEVLGRVLSYLRAQFRFQKLCFAHKDWKVMVFSPVSYNLTTDLTS